MYPSLFRCWFYFRASRLSERPWLKSDPQHISAGRYLTAHVAGSCVMFVRSSPERSGPEFRIPATWPAGGAASKQHPQRRHSEVLWPDGRRLAEASKLGGSYPLKFHVDSLSAWFWNPCPEIGRERRWAIALATATASLHRPRSK
jgi:hypothetical protein